MHCIDPKLKKKCTALHCVVTSLDINVLNRNSGVAEADLKQNLNYLFQLLAFLCVAVIVLI